ncbi:MAG TPA: hypothetical protein VF727_10175 [Allosphingosinicella sp.]
MADSQLRIGLALGAGLFALAACGGGNGDGSAKDDISERAEQRAEGYDAAADGMDNKAAAEALRNEADVIRETGERREEAAEAMQKNQS